MTHSDILAMTKSNLQISGDMFDNYLGMLIEAAQGAIATEGITIDYESVEDCNIVVMYASYLYRKRLGDDPSMPRMLRYTMNNKLFAQKAKGGGSA